MKLYSWNVNGLRATLAKDDWQWFARCNGDIIGLQETKATPEQIPEEHRNPSEYTGYWSSPKEKKGYSGVAVFSRQKPIRVTSELPASAFHGEGRVLHLEYPWFHYFNIYFPNGQKDETRLQYKLGFYDAFLEYAEFLRKEKPIVVCGDFNTAHKPIDLARPKENENVSGFLPIERAWMDKFVAHGYIDTFRHIHADAPNAYTWWSFRMSARKRNVGWRIDYFFVSEELRNTISNAWIEPEVQGSDHCPVGLELRLPE